MERLNIFLIIGLLLVGATLCIADSSDRDIEYVANRWLKSDPSHRIIEGKVFTANQVSGDFDIGQQISLTFTTPSSDSKVVHLYSDAYSSGAAHFTLLESPTVTITGVTLDLSTTALNKSRNDGITSLVNPPKRGTAGAMTNSLYMSVQGTTIDMEFLGGNKTSLNGDAWGSKEFVLIPNTKYRCQLQSLADNAYANVRLIWYEE